MRIRFSPPAVDDLDRLRRFIAEKNLPAADRIIAKLQTRIDRLVRFPRMGRRVPTARDPDRTRDLITDRHLVRYTIRSSEILIVRIWHHREDWKDW